MRPEMVGLAGPVKLYLFTYLFKESMDLIPQLLTGMPGTLMHRDGGLSGNL